MSDSTIAVTSIDLVTGKDNGTGPARAIRLTRSSSGLQASVDGGAPAAIGGGGVTSISGNGVDNTAPATPIIQSASASLEGTMTAAKFSRLNKLQMLFKEGADLTDADVTIQPYTDKCSLYVLRDGVITANRTVRLGITSSFGPFTCVIMVLDTSSHTYIVADHAGTALFTHAANSVPFLYWGYNGTGTGFIANIQQYADTP